MGFFGTDQGKVSKKKLDKVWNPALSKIADLYAGAYQNQTKALNSISSGYAGADATVVKGGANAARSISEQYAQGAAADRQHAVSSGLNSTGAADARRRGIRIDRARSLSDLDSQILEMRANIQQGRGVSMAQGYGALAGTQLGYQSMLAQIAAQRSSQYAALPQGKTGGAFGGIATLAGAGIGAFYGGAQGAKMGAGIGAGIGQTANQF